MSVFKVIFYTKGYFVKDTMLKYEGGEVYAFNGQDNESWSFFEACDLIKGMDHGFEYNNVKMWWKHGDGTLKNALRPFRDDGEVEIYTEAKPSIGNETFMENARKKNKDKICEDEVDLNTDEGSSDEDVKDVKFEDSEEERTKGFDE
ncbi:unnamed protein product [Lathyrus sativus]|nr:unnamed protein product [Lathyrus sativus]